MNTYEMIQISIQFCGVIALFITLYIYNGQLLKMGEQLRSSQENSEAQIRVIREGNQAANIVLLADLLQTEDVRQARTYLYNRLKNKPYKKWTSKDKDTASKVCSSYGTAGLILKTQLIPTEPFYENWGPSIKNCYSITYDFIKAMQKPNENGPKYWAAFDWLHEQVKNRTS